MIPQTRERTGATAETARRTTRTDIQALRAIAVLAVMLNHLWPARVTGGYVGVDVFFVISGFLITGHLLREITRNGRIDLPGFYARRVRRLLPAAMLVLVVAGVATFAFLPMARWHRAGAEILASALYVENWFLAAISVDYSALNDTASPVQHYWSLSVEEQFYLLWPIIIVGLWALAAARGWARRGVLAATLAVLAGGSIAASVYVTATSPAPAYFVTYARVWEFAAGGLVAMLVTGRHIPRLARNLLALGGLGAIIVAVVTFDARTPFPGIAALVPVLGTSAVIVAGTGTDGRSASLWHDALSARRPVQWVGDVSYSLYLWHWPLVVIAPFALVMPLNTAVKVGILAVSFLLAGATKRFIEDPGQRWGILVVSSRRTFAAMGLGMACVAGLAGALLVGAAIYTNENTPPRVVVTGSCTGPDALDPTHACNDPFGPAKNVAMGPQNEYFYAPPECGSAEGILSYGDKKTTVRCDFSGGRPDAPTVWLVGDSHAQQWQGAIFDLARERGWRVTTSYFGGCPAVDAHFLGFRQVWTDADAQVCRQWSRDVAERIEKERPGFVFTSSAGRNQLVDDGTDAPQLSQFSAGLERLWTRWADNGSTVVSLANVPYNAEVRSPECVALNPENPLACAVPRGRAEPPDPYLVAAEALHRPEVIGIDFSSAFCDADTCYAVVGGVPVYYDGDHLNLEYVRLLAPTIAAAIDR